MQRVKAQMRVVVVEAAETHQAGEAAAEGVVGVGVVCVEGEAAAEDVVGVEVVCVEGEAVSEEDVEAEEAEEQEAEVSNIARDADRARRAIDSNEHLLHIDSYTRLEQRSLQAPEEAMKSIRASRSEQGSELGYAHMRKIVEAVDIALYVLDVLLRHSRQPAQHILQVKVDI